LFLFNIALSSFKSSFVADHFSSFQVMQYIFTLHYLFYLFEYNVLM
jgi:hypothetical protein